MRGQSFPVSHWEHTSPVVPVYLDPFALDGFLDWLRPASVTDTQRAEMLKQGKWTVVAFRDLLNRYLGKDTQRDNAIKQLGIQVVDARGHNKINTQDDVFLSESIGVYFYAEDPRVARRLAELLLLARRHSPNTLITILSQERGFRRVPVVNTYYLNNRPLQGSDNLPAVFDFFSDFDIHQVIQNAIGDKINENNYGNIILEAMIAWRDYIRKQSGLPDDGYALMDKAFSHQAPKIKLNPLTDPDPKSSQQNEQKGYHRIYCGVMTAWRNPFTHEGASSDFVKSRIPDQKTLFKYLAFLSILCERADGPLP